MTASADGRKHCLVTGVSSGIGEAVAARLLADGWRVTGVSRRAPDLTHPRLHWVGCDLGAPAAVETLAAGLEPLDALVHAAGMLRSAHVGALDPAVGEAMWRLHVDAPSRLVNAVAPQLSDRGRIVLLGSRTSTGAAGKSQYAASKAALVGLARSWAMELAPRGITVNVVAPGPTATAMLVDPARAATPPRVPALGRFVEPSEVAALVGYLLGDDGGSVTGQELVVCGGASL